MIEVSPVLERLQASSFRSRFRLGPRERAYFAEKGVGVVLRHARDMIATRLGPAAPANDGRQTPMRGHPVFIAQHATATCCRGCLQKWHAIAAGQPLSVDQQAYIVAVLEGWLATQAEPAAAAREGPQLDFAALWEPVAQPAAAAPRDPA